MSVDRLLALGRMFGARFTLWSPGQRKISVSYGFVYALISNGRCVYIGQTYTTVGNRVSGHRRWIRFDQVYCAEMLAERLRVVERALIHATWLPFNISYPKEIA